jgi:hypothetical protein
MGEFLTLPFGKIDRALLPFAEHLDKKTLIDLTNSINPRISFRNGHLVSLLVGRDHFGHDPWTTLARCPALLQPPAAVRPNPANGKCLCYRFLQLNYPLSQPAIAAIKMPTTHASAGRRKPEHFRRTHRRCQGKQFWRSWLRMRQVNHARLLHRALDDSQDHAAWHVGLSAWAQNRSPTP